MEYKSNKNPKGKLYSKFYNFMRFLKSTGLVTSNVKNFDKPISHKHSIDFGKIFLTHCLGASTYDVFLLNTFVICIRTRKR
jgi:hypothetical protein